ncbi:AbiV family abortive infection protein [Muricauda sp. MAR_2010_75]|uniref:AbiV family abortive infection protein n=1 Tax=Allomuricauda sp. MAR_2010_75 TaxID=1250232 RepID=UPI00055FD25A|nr:AbiV family abortive infection protein [Muricauda sp. MAR_2010_75]
MKNDAFYLDGYRHALDNAKSLLDIATCASEMNNRGAGTSLCILSAEESIKAVFILQQSVNPNQKISDYEDIFKSHKTKHEYIVELFKQMDRFRFKILEEYGKVRHDRKLRRKVARKNPKIMKTVDWAFQNFKSIPEMMDTFDWFEKANVQKNYGLYLGLNQQKGAWNIPIKTEAIVFKRALRNAKNIYEYAVYSKEILTDPSVIKKHQTE